jgi:hypothetical protein
MSDATRRLCCAPYVDDRFGNAVIREVVESERKAVPPSFGFDLDPVVRHCLRARRLMIARYAFVTGILVVGLCLTPVWTIGWLFLCAAVVGLQSPSLRQLPRAVRLGLGATAGFVLLCFAGYTVAGLVLGRLLSSVGLGGRSTSQFPGLGESTSPTYEDVFSAGMRNFLAFAPLLLAAAMFAALFLSRRHIYGVLSTELAPGARAGAPRSSNHRVEWRLGLVAAMQRGNISIHDLDPFAGAGWIQHDWSFAISLKPRSDDDDPPRRTTERIRIDAAELNRRVQQTVLGLRDAELRDGEKISNVFVVPYVAADGNRCNDDPLIDPQSRTPRTLASPETIAAIEACPQGGLRHYLRAVVPANGKDIRTPDGQLVLPAQDSGIGVNAFIHLAVEGGMLYAEFVATVMPELDPRYHLVDNLRPERVQARALLDTFRAFFSDNLLGPFYLVQTGWDALRLQSRMARSARAADEFRFYDYGARFSVRELGARLPTVKFMQVLDGWKYIKLLDKAVTESVISFLDDNGVDTTEFENAVTNISYRIGSVNVSGGQQNFGGRNVNIQHNQTGAARTATTAKGGGASRG